MNTDHDQFQAKLIAITKAGMFATALAVVVGLISGSKGWLTKEQTVVVCSLIAVIVLPLSYAWLRFAGLPYFDEGQLTVLKLDVLSEETLASELTRLKGRKVSILAFRHVPLAEVYADKVRDALKHFGIESVEDGVDGVVAIGQGNRLPFKITVGSYPRVEKRVRVEHECMPHEVVTSTLMGICQFINAEPGGVEGA